jgi:2-hydroxy-4-carboxymuconate semialdehyde hemiacetal dehydrogenase
MPVKPSLKLAVAEVGAFGRKHLDGLKLIDGVDVIAVVDPNDDLARATAAPYGIAREATELADVLATPALTR